MLLLEVGENQKNEESTSSLAVSDHSESFDLFDNQSIIRRTVTLRTGEKRFSDLSLIGEAAPYENLADLYDKTWLQTKCIPATKKNALKVIKAADLFCGCGGLSVGLREAARALEMNVDFAFASDVNETALSVYKENFRPKFSSSLPLETFIDGDPGEAITVSEKDLIDRIGDIDFVIAGPPCQGHSDLNNHTRRDDPKNQLIVKVARFAELFRPKYVVIENVPGIKHDRLGSLNHAKGALKKLGYHLDETVMKADLFGVPQARKRFFLVATLSEADSLTMLETVQRKDSRNVSWALNDLLNVSDRDVFNTSAVPSKDNLRRIKYLFDFDIYDLPNSERPPCHRDKKHSYNSVYGRMYWNKPSQTITTGFGSVGQGRFVHPLKERTLTPHEAARIQFFPDFFEFGNLGRRQMQLLIGNAVPSKLSYMLALHLLR